MADARATLVFEAGGLMLAGGEGWLQACFARDDAARGLARLQARLDVEVFVVAEDAERLAAWRAQAMQESTRIAEESPVGTDATDGEPWPARWPTGIVPEALVEHVVRVASRLGVSDLYLAPQPGLLALAARLHGGVRALPPVLGPERRTVLDVLRVRSGITPLQSGRATEGRMAVAVDGVVVELRVQSLPSTGGDALAMRLLDPRRLEAARQGGALPGPVAAAGRAFLEGSGGLFLLVGPTDSGKTTTLHRLLATRDARRERIVTLENPVEYRLEGALQLPVDRDPDSRRGALETLVGCLRTTPDILVLGEIRTAAEAAVAVEAGLTGHRVLATLHAADPDTALARLDALGVPAGLRDAALRGIVAQRLLPCPCARCAVPVALPPDLREHYLEAGLPVPEAIRESPGCESCGGLPVGRTLVHAIHPGHDGAFAKSALEALAVGLVAARAVRSMVVAVRPIGPGRRVKTACSRHLGIAVKGS